MCPGCEIYKPLRLLLGPHYNGGKWKFILAWKIALEKFNFLCLSRNRIPATLDNSQTSLKTVFFGTFSNSIYCSCNENHNEWNKKLLVDYQSTNGDGFYSWAESRLLFSLRTWQLKDIKRLMIICKPSVNLLRTVSNMPLPHMLDCTLYGFTLYFRFE